MVPTNENGSITYVQCSESRVFEFGTYGFPWNFSILSCDVFYTGAYFYFPGRWSFQTDQPITYKNATLYIDSFFGARTVTGWNYHLSIVNPFTGVYVGTVWSYAPQTTTYMDGFSHSLVIPLGDFTLPGNVSFVWNFECDTNYNFTTTHAWRLDYDQVVTLRDSND
jgi:hypothetical protein